jgi:hypothetical protein
LEDFFITCVESHQQFMLLTAAMERFSPSDAFLTYLRAKFYSATTENDALLVSLVGTILARAAPDVLRVVFPPELSRFRSATETFDALIRLAADVDSTHLVSVVATLGTDDGALLTVISAVVAGDHNDKDCFSLAREVLEVASVEVRAMLLAALLQYRPAVFREIFGTVKNDEVFRVAAMVRFAMMRPNEWMTYVSSGEPVYVVTRAAEKRAANHRSTSSGRLLALEAGTVSDSIPELLSDFLRFGWAREIAERCTASDEETGSVRNALVSVRSIGIKTDGCFRARLDA